MSELTRFSSESEEVLKSDFNIIFDSIGYRAENKDNSIMLCLRKIKWLSIQHCSFLLLQWLLDRECSLGKDLIKQWGNDNENKDYGKYTFGRMVFWIAKNKDLITAIDSAVKAIKEQE